MLAAQYSSYSNDFKTVSLVQVNKPKAQAKFALVKIKFAASNPVDCGVMAGLGKAAGWKMTFPFTMGYDFSGIIEALDESDIGKPFQVGDEVFCVNWGNAKHDDDDGSEIAGTFAEYISIPIRKLSKKPATVTFEQAAAVALVGTTAYQSLGVLNVTASSKILILGGSTAVGYLAIQLAKNRGAWVATTCSTRTVEYVRTVNPDRIINYKEQQWDKLEDLKELDFVFDAVGEPKWFSRVRDGKLLKETGSCLSIRDSSECGFNPLAHPPMPYAGFFCLSCDPSVQDKLAEMIGNGSLKVPIDKEYPFTSDGIFEMLTYQESGASLGKNILRIV